MKGFMQRREVTIQSMTLQDQRGFTLVELMVAAGLSLFVLASMYGVFRSQTHTAKGQESRMEAHEYAMSVLDIMVREIRNSGYFPNGLCNATGGVVEATATSFRLVYDANGDGDCLDADEDIKFELQGSNILRNTQALTDSNVTALLFTYFPQQTGGAAPPPMCFTANNPAGCNLDLTQATNWTNIQRIAISVTVQARSPDVQFGGQSTITMSSGADLRNHGVAP
jgi:prepilin-type N-terminal cleavage/methylation domain-containing protein